MSDAPPAIVITGISGNLGRRVLPMLDGFRVVGVDFRPPESAASFQFVEMDLGLESSCLRLLQLMRDVRPVALVHLAFVMDAVRTGVLDRDRMWQINVAGTARVMEAAAEANRDWPMIEKLIFVSSVSAYGADLNPAASEDRPLAARDYVYGIHKMEADNVVRQRAPGLRGCSAYVLRPHIFAGPGIDNYFMEAFRGIPGGSSKWARKLREKGTRLACMLPAGDQYLRNRLQFVHIDDVARLLVHILKKNEPESQRLTVLNVAGSGQPLSYGECVEMAKAKLLRVPGQRIFEWILEFLWKAKISTIPPDVASYMTSDSVMDTSRLQDFLGPEYKNVIRHSAHDAFAECFTAGPVAQAAAVLSSSSAK
jgi:nucleoside-diphosphate-sugar epimerase